MMPRPPMGPASPPQQVPGGMPMVNPTQPGPAVQMPPSQTAPQMLPYPYMAATPYPMMYSMPVASSSGMPMMYPMAMTFQAGPMMYPAAMMAPAMASQNMNNMPGNTWSGGGAPPVNSPPGGLGSGAPPVNPQDRQHLVRTVQQQIEYYFGVDNLCKDMYLRKHMSEEGWVPLSLIANFARVRP